MKNHPKGAPLSPKELDEMVACATQEAWLAFCDQVQAARAGVWPCDWVQHVITRASAEK